MNFMKSEYDVVVVGGGPAGLVSALRLVREGVKVLVLDKKQEIGKPLRCAEMTSAVLLGHFMLDRDIGSCIRRRYSGYVVVLDRGKLEKRLAEEIIRRGGEVNTDVTVLESLPYRKNSTGVVAKVDGRPVRIKSKLVIACDGTESLIARKRGIAPLLTPATIASCYAAIMDCLGLLEPNNFRFFFLPGLAPFYFWIIPHADTVANVGVGLPGRLGKQAQKIFTDFVRQHEELRTGRILTEIVGVLPAAPPLEQPYDDGLIVCGNAARHVDALTGEGITYAVYGGICAAETYLEAAAKDDFSKNTLRSYRERLSFHNNLQRTYARLAASGVMHRGNPDIGKLMGK